ncbi:hypothetical protein [Candidatus Neptunochlamydia vexilliferae]|nr:hypothetical protein [Candidatus Neptunochlamydia vexilliferae]
MLFEKEVEHKDEVSEGSREQRIEELKSFIKAQRHLHDDHGAAIIGSHDRPPVYPKD